MSLLDLLGSIKTGLLGGIDNGAQNALGPQAGLLSANPSQPGAPPPQPTPDQVRQRRASYLGNIGAALQTGQPIQSGIQNYQQQQLAQMQATHQIGMQNRAQQLLGQFSQEMQAAGADQAKQAQIVAKYAPYLPAADIRGIASLVRTETPKTVAPKVKEVRGNMAIMDDGTTRKLSDVPDEQKLQAMGNGNVFDPSTGLTGAYTVTVNGKPQTVRQNLRTGQYIDLSGQPIDPKATITPYSAKALTPAEQQDQDIIAQYASKNGIPIDQMTGAQRQAARDAHTQAMAKFNAAQKIEIHNSEQKATAPVPGGDAFKSQLAQKVASGEISLEQLGQIFPSRGQAGSQQRSEIVQQAMALNPKLDLTGASATYKNNTNHQTVSTVKYIDNLNTNLGMLDSAVDTLGSGDWNAFNKLKMRAGGEFGNTNVSNYNALHSVMVNEAARALSGNGSVSDAARKEASSIIPQFGSPAQVHQAIATLRQELANRKSTLIAPVQYGQQAAQPSARRFVYDPQKGLVPR
jgi:hypothetical protein